MIKGMAMLSCPESAVTIKVAKDATARDHQRLRGADEQFSRRSLIKRAAALSGNSLKLKYVFRGSCFSTRKLARALFNQRPIPSVAFHQHKIDTVEIFQHIVAENIGSEIGRA